ncbi:MAG: hypothetical protein O7G86_04105 [Gammaproteobacteria bacterium]|nr:hypothetical protein [Gammaproteobacteria bacterium]MCZ6853084.1 hypothetical protein [Gammaproteobacteria bacterium]
MKIVGKLLQVLILFSIGPLLAHSTVQSGTHAERQKAGIIETVEVNSSGLIVDGIRYRVAIDAQIEIGGSFGAFTMLQAGMKIQFTYKDLSDTRREIVRIEQIPSHFRVEEA